MQLIDINGRIEDIAGKIYPLNLNVEKQKYSIDLGFYFFYILFIMNLNKKHFEDKRFNS